MSGGAEDGVETGPAASPSVPRCYRHPERETYIRCQRCDRNICPDCQRQAPVGFQCVECVREGARSMPAVRTRFGGVVRDGAVVTKVLIGLNVAVFLLIWMAGRPLLSYLELIGYYPFADLTGGAGGVANGEYWRLLTMAFAHTAIWHLALNLLALWVLGPSLELLLGRLRFTGLYLVSVLAGSAAAYALTEPVVATIGASGGVFGLFGARIVLARRINENMTWIYGLLGINLVLNVLWRDTVSWQGHLGGLVAGVLLGAFIMYAPRERRDQVQAAGFALVLVLTLAVVVWRTVTLAAAVPG